MTTRTAMVVAAITDYAVNDLIRHAMEHLRFRGPHRIQRRPPGAVNMPHPTWFAWLMVILSGVATMMANAAGPIMALYRNTRGDKRLVLFPSPISQNCHSAGSLLSSTTLPSPSIWC